MVVSEQELELLARDALTSPCEQTRRQAADALRFLSSYEQWEHIKELFSRTRNVHLLFILAKSIHFVVSNEIGPQERSEIQVFVLHYVQANLSSALPKYMLNVIFSIYSAALYLNWRLMVISSEEEEGAMTSLGQQIEGTLTSYLPPHLVIDCMGEILSHFSREDCKSGLQAVRVSFAKSVLPYFFKYAEAQTKTVGLAALQLCCNILESVPPINGPLVTVTLTTEDSIYVAPGVEWLPTLSQCVANCSQYAAGDPESEFGDVCLKLLRLASTVMISDWGSRNDLRDQIDALNQNLVTLSVELMQLFQVRRSPGLLSAATTLMVNCYERDEIAVGRYLFVQPNVLTLWANVTTSACARWTEEEQDNRQSLLHFFYLVGTRTLAKQSCAGEPENGVPDSDISRIILEVFQAYLSNVMAKAHIAEDSQEIRCSEGLVLHNEAHLQPLAAMMFCEGLNFAGLVGAEFKKALEMYESCIRLRRGEKVSEETLLALMIMSSDYVSALAGDDLALFLINVCLSRISTVISIVSMAVQNSSVHHSDPIVDDVSSFLKQLVGCDDDITDVLLECMSLSSNSPSRAPTSAGSTSEKRLHVGVLRSLFFFCNGILDSDFGRYKIVEDGIELICFVLQKHSDQIPLVSDAVQLLRRYITSKINTPIFLNSDRMSSLIEKCIAGNVSLLDPRVACVSSAVRQAREDVLQTLSSYLESRSLYTFPTKGAFFRLICLSGATLTDQPTTCLRDLCALAEGCSSAQSLLQVLRWVTDNNEVLVAALRGPFSGPCRPELLRLWSMLTSLSIQHLREDNINEVQWEFASLVFCSMDYYLTAMQVRNSEGTDFFFPPNCVTEEEMYDICTVILSSCSGSWCNLGVMLYYGEDSIINVLLNAVDALLTIPVEQLVSREDRRHKVFNAIVSCLTFSYPPSQLKLAVALTQTWPKLLYYLVQCLTYRFSHLVVNCVKRIIMLLSPPGGQGWVIPAELLQSIIREISTSLSTTTLAEETFELSFDVMRMCFERGQEACEAVLQDLLSFCSAYHRVRLRCILMMLRNGPANPAKNFVSVFGLTSKVATLAAW